MEGVKVRGGAYLFKYTILNSALLYYLCGSGGVAALHLFTEHHRSSSQLCLFPCLKPNSSYGSMWMNLLLVFLKIYPSLALLAVPPPLQSHLPLALLRQPPCCANRLFPERRSPA